MISFVRCNILLQHLQSQKVELWKHKKMNKTQTFYSNRGYMHNKCTSIHKYGKEIWRHIILILNSWQVLAYNSKEMIWGHVAYFLFKYSKEVKVKVTSCSSSSSCFWFIFIGDSLLCFYATCSDCNHLSNFQTFIFFFLVFCMRCIL